MNSQEFYREIGDIDDDLIQAANESHRQKNNVPMLYRIAGIAACFCLIFGGILFGLKKDTLYINDMPVLPAYKGITPNDENTIIVPMTYQELLAYYGLTQLPDSFGGELTRTEQSYFVLYQDQTGKTLYDTNTLYYSNTDESKLLSITFAKVGEASNTSSGDVKRSKIGGISMVLSSMNQMVYSAEFKLNGVSVKMLFNGLDQEDFINVVKEFIRLLK